MWWQIYLASLGRIVYDALLKDEIAVKYYWDLKAIDSILTSANTKEFPTQECQSIVDKLIDNLGIKTTIIFKQ